MIKKYLTLLGLFCLIYILVSAQQDIAKSYNGPREALHIYLLIGQSNMAGRAPLTDQQSSVIERCYLFNDKDQWEPAQNPLNRYSTIRKELSMQRLNPGYSFSQTMLAHTKNISIGLVVNAKGGTMIEQWEKGGVFYSEAVKRTKKAQQQGILKGILWHQGESNSQNAAGYLEKLETLISDLRQDLGIINLPFIAGQINNVPDINVQIEKLPQNLDFCGYVSSHGLTTFDRWHFDSKSMLLLGERYAEEMLRIQLKRSEQ